MTLALYTRDADIQDAVSIRQFNMLLGWTQEVWTAGVSVAVSAGRKCEVGNTQRERRTEPRRIRRLELQTRGRA